MFGEVVEGWETLEKLNNTICDLSNRPYQVEIAGAYIFLKFPPPLPLKIPLESLTGAEIFYQKNFLEDIIGTIHSFQLSAQFL